MTISPQPLTSTNSSSLNGRDTVTGGSIIMPSDISDAETTMSMTRNGMKMTKPMMNAARSSDRTNAGIRVVSAHVVGVRRLRLVGHLGEQRDLVLAGVLEHELAQRLARRP